MGSIGNRMIFKTIFLVGRDNEVVQVLGHVVVQVLLGGFLVLVVPVGLLVQASFLSRLLLSGLSPPWSCGSAHRRPSQRT